MPLTFKCYDGTFTSAVLLSALILPSRLLGIKAAQDKVDSNSKIKNPRNKYSHLCDANVERIDRVAYFLTSSGSVVLDIR